MAHDGTIRYRLHLRETRFSLDLTVADWADGFEVVYAHAMDVRYRDGWTVVRVERTVDGVTHPNWRWLLPNRPSMAADGAMPESPPALATWP